MPRIFVSYSRDNESFAHQLAQSLSEAGADVWIDVEDIPVGMNWSTAIQEGLDTSDVLLVVLSPSSMASKNVAQEWQYFIDHDRPIVPILYQPTSIHFQLNRLQYIDFYNNPYETALLLLYQHLSKLGVKGLTPSRNLPPPTGNANNPRPIDSSSVEHNVKHRQRKVNLTLPIIGVLAVMVMGLIVVIGMLLMRGDRGQASETPPAVAIEASVVAT